VTFLDHPCSTKDFRVLAGLTPDTLREVIHGSLKNDAIPESFRVQYTNSLGVPFPSRYVKIIPLSYVSVVFHSMRWELTLNIHLEHIAQATIRLYGTLPWRV
jgi:muskelin